MQRFLRLPEHHPHALEDKSMQSEGDGRITIEDLTCVWDDERPALKVRLTPGTITRRLRA